MIEFELDAEVLGNTVFGISPLAEVASSLRLLGASSPDRVHRRWLSEVRDRQVRLPSGDLDLLMDVVPASKWIPDFLFPPVSGPRTTIGEQLQQISSLPVDTLANNMAEVWPDASWPPRLRRLLDRGADAPTALAEALATYWSVMVNPYWDRISAVLEEDVSFRASTSLRGGLFDLLADLHPRVVLSGSRLVIAMPAHSDARYDQAKLSLVPSVFVWPGLVLTHARPGAFELTYGARGTARVWEGSMRPPGDSAALVSLLGRSRAAILLSLSFPLSTTQVARQLGQSPASVSHHLSVLRGCGLATSWRNGRSVLYYQTPLACSLVAANREHSD